MCIHTYKQMYLYIYINTYIYVYIDMCIFIYIYYLQNIIIWGIDLRWQKRIGQRTSQHLIRWITHPMGTHPPADYTPPLSSIATSLCTSTLLPSSAAWVPAENMMGLSVNTTRGQFCTACACLKWRFQMRDLTQSDVWKDLFVNVNDWCLSESAMACIHTCIDACTHIFVYTYVCILTHKIYACEHCNLIQAIVYVPVG